MTLVCPTQASVHSMFNASPLQPRFKSVKMRTLNVDPWLAEECQLVNIFEHARLIWRLSVLFQTWLRVIKEFLSVKKYFDLFHSHNRGLTLANVG